MSKLAPAAIIDNEIYSIIDVVKHVSSQRRIVLCKSPTDETKFVFESEWPVAQEPSEANPQPNYATPAPVTHASPLQDKISLIMSLFKGRSDVYAAGFVGKTTKPGKLEYWPKCTLRHIRGACPKQQNPKLTCSNCEHPRYDPLTPDIVASHCKGADSRGRPFAIGIYVVDVDQCYFLAADFDGPGWQEAAAAYRDTCRNHALSPAVERSRSGNGAHVWVFFDGPVSAALARRVGEGLLSEARATCTVITFASYDRLFPLQDSVSPGNLGSLIALPLQGDAFRKGNSVFLDDGFNPYPDQCAYLSTLPKASAAHISRLATEFGTDPIGLPLSTDRDLKAEPPAKPQLDSLIAQPAPEPLPSTTLVRLADGIHITRKDLPPAIVNQLRKLAAFRNPAFTKNLRLHLSTRDTPRFIDLSQMDEDELVLPRGCTQAALSLFRNAGIEPTIIDARVEGKHVDATFQGKLRPLQEPCKSMLVTNDLGVIVAPTGFGKSVIAASIIAHHKVNTLVIVPNTSLLKQWRESLRKFLLIDEEPPILRTPTGRKRKKQPGTVGIIGGGERLPSGIVDIALASSLFERGEVEGDSSVSPLIHDYGMVIVDEAQHIPASKELQVLQSIRARYVYSITATPKRDDGLDRIIFLECGPLRHEVKVADQISEQGMRRLLIPRFTFARPDLEGTSTWHSFMDYVCANEERNKLILDDAMRAVEAGRTPLVLTRRVEHARTLAAALGDKAARQGLHVALLVGQETNSVKKQQLEDLRAVPDDKQLCVVATGNYIGEGFDLSRLDTLLLAGPVAFEGALAQWVGRLHRVREGKREVFVLDYVDSAIPMFDNEWKARLRAYKRLGYAMAEESDLGLVGLAGKAAPEGHLFGHEDFSDAFDADLDGCRASLVVASSWCRFSRVRALRQRLEELVGKGVQVSVMLRKPKQATLEWDRVQVTLREAGVKVSVVDGNAHLDYAVCDASLVWYGSIAPLGFPRKDDCSIRFANRELAAELIEQAAS